MSEFKVRPDWMAFCLPDISEAEIQADADVIRSGWWAKGPRTMEFQEKFAEYVGAKHCIAVNSCTAALHLALLAKGIGPGDEVITTPLTFASTANTILHVGATPVFADIIPVWRRIWMPSAKSAMSIICSSARMLRMPWKHAITAN